jgi:hypothetical protein
LARATIFAPIRPVAPGLFSKHVVLLVLLLELLSKHSTDRIQAASRRKGTTIRVVCAKADAPSAVAASATQSALNRFFTRRRSADTWSSEKALAFCAR